jgi:hypothetical protein
MELPGDGSAPAALGHRDAFRALVSKFISAICCFLEPVSTPWSRPRAGEEYTLSHNITTQAPPGQEEFFLRQQGA